MFSITSRETFEAARTYIEHVMRTKDLDRHSLPIILIGNKRDLQDERQVSTDEAQQLATEYNITYIGSFTLSRLLVLLFAHSFGRDKRTNRFECRVFVRFARSNRCSRSTGFQQRLLHTTARRWRCRQVCNHDRIHAIRWRQQRCFALLLHRIRPGLSTSDRARTSTLHYSLIFK